MAKMAKLDHYFQSVGLQRNASPDAVHQAYKKWRGFLRPMLIAERDNQINYNARWQRAVALHQMDEAYAVLLQSRAAN